MHGTDYMLRTALAADPMDDRLCAIEGRRRQLEAKKSD
jgi:hypothetical protein